MTLRQALLLARQTIACINDVENPSLESEILLRYALKISRAQLLLDIDKELSPAIEVIFRKWIERRLNEEPIAYIIGCREFFGLDFYVDKRVLIPRPETETIIEESIRFSHTHHVTSIADIGTGSGAIAISLAVNLPQSHIYATDISGAALEVARINCQKHNMSDRITLLQGDLLHPLPQPVDILVANLPYVNKEDVARMPSAKYEPVLALDGGKNGLDKIIRISSQLKNRVNSSGCMLFEIGKGQSKAVFDLMFGQFPSSVIEIISDLAGIERVVKILL